MAVAQAESQGQTPMLSSEDLMKALEDQTDEHLQEMGRRLFKSTEGMAEMLAMEEAESSSLTEESRYLNETIDLMMKELHKLNIGGMNTVEPQLEEGPMAFVGRYWEKVKPRDTAYQTGEHVGEIKKPLVTDGGAAPPAQVAQEIAQHASQQVVQTAQRIQGKLGPLWQRTQGFIKDKQGEITGAVERAQAQRAEAMAKQKATQKSAKKAQRSQAKQQTSAGGSSSSAAQKPSSPAAQKPSSPERQSESGAAPSAAAALSSAKPSAAAVPKPAEAPAPKDVEVAEPQAAPAAAASPVAAAVSAAVEAAAAAPIQADASADGGGAADAEEQMQSTLLIEAHLKIDDGSVLVLQVKAADRCKEVAQRFVADNSLKAWFQDPLTTWLKKVEADAVKFPVKVEGDLMEIRKLHAKSKPGAKA